MIWKVLLIFFVGLGESFLASLHLKFFQRNKKFWTFITSVINTVIWYFILASFVENLGNISLVLAYSLAMGIGDVLAIKFDTYLDKLSKKYGIKIRFKRHGKRKR